MSIKAAGERFDVDAIVEELTSKDEPKSIGTINDKPVTEASSLITRSNKPSKGWSITAMVIGVIVLGVGTCGGIGLLNICNKFPLPDGIAGFFGHIGFKGLLSVTVVGVVVGGIALGSGIYKYRQITKLEREIKAVFAKINLNKFNDEHPPQNDASDLVIKDDMDIKTNKNIAEDASKEDPSLLPSQKHSKQKLTYELKQDLRSQLDISSVEYKLTQVKNGQAKLAFKHLPRSEMAEAARHVKAARAEEAKLEAAKAAKQAEKIERNVNKFNSDYPKDSDLNSGYQSEDELGNRTFSGYDEDFSHCPENSSGKRIHNGKLEKLKMELRLGKETLKTLTEMEAKQAEKEARLAAEEARLDNMFSEDNFEKIGMASSAFNLSGRPYTARTKNGKDFYVRMKDGKNQCTLLLDSADSKAMEAYMKR